MRLWCFRNKETKEYYQETTIDGYSLHKGVVYCDDYDNAKELLDGNNQWEIVEVNLN